MDSPEPSGPWSRDRLDEFLTSTTIPLRLSCRTPADDPWMLSLWYEWDPEVPELRCATAADADVVRFLRAHDEVAFEISTNDPPYRGVRGRGTATIEPDDEKAVLSRLLHRYLGDTDSALAKRLLSPERDEVTIRIRPTKLHTWDYANRMETTR
ncbi:MULTISPECIES: pyridoxamine 5'-phosphate oxidase family protein [Haloferax]|uniref:Pyridoxamine 5'-phosphate oxidase family protein n=2 Tax=Haloferax TaxID=2251 RepID=A0A6G1Z0U6_9EURY|nr:MULTISPECIES: pyridoxamine 5'-phosphate oxidase family protein [Haloferax]KAB1187463.1 pyridoxamine 5'-phosphate oxidase family protein [Haloferax sp. CBA1149]MRW80115.1 pyridoxamine 5'-phosphate oxidase family protein [Haloferax marinisediminis]